MPRKILIQISILTMVLLLMNSDLFAQTRIRFRRGAGLRDQNKRRRVVRFTLAADGQSFSGTWRRSSGRREPPSGTWEGKCIQP